MTPAHVGKFRTQNDTTDETKEGGAVPDCSCTPAQFCVCARRCGDSPVNCNRSYFLSSTAGRNAVHVRAKRRKRSGKIALSDATKREQVCTPQPRYWFPWLEEGGRRNQRTARQLSTRHRDAPRCTTESEKVRTILPYTCQMLNVFLVVETGGLSV